MKKKIISLVLATAIAMCGCQKAPENAAVKKKDFDNMIKEAQETTDKDNAPENMAKKYDSYKNEITDKKMGVHVTADAKVDIPKSKKMSVYRVSQKKIEQSMVDKIKDQLFEGDEIYDGCILKMDTKATVAEEIRQKKEQLANLSEGGDPKEYIEASIKELQKKYDKVPKTIDKSKYKSDMKLTKVKDLYEKDKNNSYYEWQNEFGGDNEVIYAISDAKDGYKKNIYIQNNKNYGNIISFSKNKSSYGQVSSITVSEENNMMDTNCGMWKVGVKPSYADIIFETGSGVNIIQSMKEVKDDTCTLSEKKAKAKADEFLKNIGISGFDIDTKGQYYELLANQEEDKYEYRKVWYFKYLRSIDNVLVNNEGDSKYADSGQGESFTKYMWPGESIQICINDQGVVEFRYGAPIKVNKKVVENAKLKTFEQARKIFEKMIVTTNANEDGDGYMKNISVSKVALRYMRISEKDKFDTGLLVPVWDFIGTYEDDAERDSSYRDKSILTVNAIDGTVIDKGLGY